MFGATGLVGSYLVDELIRLDDYNQIIIFTRRETTIKNTKIRSVINSLESLDEIKDSMKGDDLFCCLGTTIKKAGTQEAFKNVDLTLPKKLAEIASRNHVNNFAVVSSLGANAESRNFYLKVKGQMEFEITKNNFGNIIIVRPSLLIGKRKEFRFSEGIAKMISPLMNPFLKGKLRKYRSIHGRTVAKAMIYLVLFPREKTVFESDELTDIVNSTSL